MKKRRQERKRKKTARGFAISAAVLGLALAGVWLTQTQQPFPNVRVVKGEKTTAASTRSAGQKAFIDPATGQFREPTAEEEQALAAQGGLAAGDASAPIEVAGEGGGVHMLVPADLQTSVAAVRNPDGSISLVHAQGAGNLPSSTSTSRKEPANDR
jgi:hypothetical protein